jgi:outer membrane protein TolC
MLRYIVLFLLLIARQSSIAQQRMITQEEAVNRAINNQRNLRGAHLSVQQQEQLLRGASGLQSPQVFGELTPYEPMILGVQQTLSLPKVYRNRKALQNERIGLARLQLQGSQIELKREVRMSYLQIQFLTERARLLRYQDSIYQAIKIASKRFFDAGQINKLEELQAASQADGVRNDLLRNEADLSVEMQIFRFYTSAEDSFEVESIQMYVYQPTLDTSISNVQQQILQQQLAISQRELQVERSELLPQVQAGISLPTTKEFERPVGVQFGITIPIWQRQNRSRIAAAQTATEIIQVQQELEQQRLNARYRQALAGYQREWQSLNYFNNTALPQARAIIQTSQRLFQGGELNYIESLRNLQMAFDIFYNHLETHRAFNEAVIHLNYLKGTL